MNEEFVNRREVIDKINSWEGRSVIELYGALGGGKTETVNRAVEEAINEGKIAEGEFIRIEFEPNTGIGEFIQAFNSAFGKEILTETGYRNVEGLRHFFHRNFSNIFIFFDNTENLELNFSKEFATWTLDVLYPAVKELRYKKIVLSGRVPLDGYPAYFSSGYAYPLQIYLGPIEHEFVKELIQNMVNREEHISFDLLRDLRFVSGGIPRGLKEIINEFKKNDIPDRFGDAQIKSYIEKQLNSLKEKMVDNGLDDNEFELISTNLFSVRSFEEFWLFSSVFDMGEKEVRDLRESLYKARFIIKYTVRRPAWHYTTFITDPAIRWILSAYVAQNNNEQFVNVEEKLILLYAERMVKDFEVGRLDSALMWFLEWLYHLCLLNAFRNYPPDPDGFLETIGEKIGKLKEKGVLFDLSHWKYSSYFEKEYREDEFWWFLQLFPTEDGTFFREFNEIVGSIVKLG